MKKIATAVLIIFAACVIGLGMKIGINKSNNDIGSRKQYTEETDHKISNSERYHNEEISAMINDYAERYQHSFTFASTEIEEQLYGVWQARGYAGHTRSSRYQWDGLWGDVVILCEGALIYGGTPCFNPVYACYKSCAEDLETDTFLDLEWVDGRYAGLDGIVILAVGREKDGERALGMPYRFILMGEYLMIERGGSYFALEKVGIMEPYDEDVISNDPKQTEEIAQKISNSERYYNEEVRSVIDYYETKYHHSFIPATTEMEKNLYGVWQIKECVGIMEESDSRGEGMVGDMIIFSENAWISGGTPSFKPVYVYYESCAGETGADSFFENVIWINGLDADWNGKVLAGIETEKNAKYGSGHQQDEPFKMIMTDDSLMIEKGGLYFKTQKVGEVEWYQSLLNVEPY
ncbi:MAG: hypothetical protein K2I96_05335 [Lachnospiraceae bacterium]|nr:hypothetical protein [Lachnospiraceae bacterium]